jgi:RNA polymerase sigma-70 factor (ECF subfamily)
MRLRQVTSKGTGELALDIGAGNIRSDPQHVVEALYAEHYDPLYRYLVLTGSTPADADEYVQEGFLRLIRALRGREPVERPRHWLFRVVHNLRADEWRHSGRHECVPIAESSHMTAAGEGHNPESELLDRERTERLRVAFLQLTERQTAILHMRAEGLKFREIADILGITLQSASEVCARAMERLGRLVHD